ncbi:uncharacterized protein LOC143859666 [Tasmannia lanceolata]|uniref:uncharacterized protein LOC143859666 n=1 Tax=Tasmannia lanceolata TaxID=3420 RepID=UPI0040631FD7
MALTRSTTMPKPPAPSSLMSCSEEHEEIGAPPPHPPPCEKSSPQKPRKHCDLKTPQTAQKSTGEPSDEDEEETHLLNTKLTQPNEHSTSDSGESESDSSPQKPINSKPKKPEATPNPLKSSIEPSNNEKGSKRKRKASNDKSSIEPSNNTQPNEHSTSDSGESESDSSPQKPINSKPKKPEATPNPLKSSIEPSNNEKGSKRKRKASNDKSSIEPSNNEKVSKRKRKASNETVNNEGEPAKKNLFERLWSEDDEIVILKGMVEFIKKGCNPITDKKGFKSFIKDSISIEFRKKQMNDKICKLKKKYERNSSRAAKGKVLNFSDSHQKNSYHLSEKIWGGNMVAWSEAYGVDSTRVDMGAGSKSRNSKVGNETVDYDFLHSNLVQNLNMNYYDGSMLKKGLNLVESAKGRSLEERWKKLQLIEMDIYRRRFILIKEQMDAIFDALRSSL